MTVEFEVCPICSAEITIEYHITPVDQAALLSDPGRLYVHDREAWVNVIHPLTETAIAPWAMGEPYSVMLSAIGGTAVDAQLLRSHLMKMTVKLFETVHPEYPAAIAAAGDAKTTI